MKSVRPNLTTSQINELKEDIKYLSRHIKRAANLRKNPPINAIANHVARLLQFSSFSELRIYKLDTIHPMPFSLWDEINDAEVYELYHRHVQIDASTAAEALSNAIKEKRPPKKEALAYNKLVNIMNSSAYSEHEYHAEDSGPDRFKIEADEPYFKKLSEGDHFIVEMPNGTKYHYTIMSKDHYHGDKSKSYYSVQRGMWVEMSHGAYCVSMKARG